jgi:hypothetical protein
MRILQFKAGHFTTKPGVPVQAKMPRSPGPLPGIHGPLMVDLPWFTYKTWWCSIGCLHVYQRVSEGKLSVKLFLKKVRVQLNDGLMMG